MEKHSTTSFETKPLKECVGQTQQMDRLCFPQEMWMVGTELEALIDMEAEATLLKRNGKLIGQALTLSETAAVHVLDGADAKFIASKLGVYSYSEAIIPEYQKQGYGTLLLTEIAVRMKAFGFTSVSAHVRTRFGWNKRRERELNVQNSHFIYDFWEDPREVVQFQSAQL